MPKPRSMLFADHLRELDLLAMQILAGELGSLSICALQAPCCTSALT